MVLGNDQTQVFYWPFHASEQTAEHERLWVKEWHRTDFPVTKSRRRVRLQRVFEAFKTAAYYNTCVKLMIKIPSLTLIFNPHTCARVDKNTEQVLYAPNAIHFWGGMEYATCVALEMAVKADENFENVVDSWNYVIGQVGPMVFSSRFLNGS